MNAIKFKVDMLVELDDIKNELKKRDVAVNKTNINRFIKLIQQGQFSLKSEFYEDVPKDRETLLIYGFTFDKREKLK
jgi:hypothetical protein